MQPQLSSPTARSWSSIPFCKCIGWCLCCESMPESWGFHTHQFVLKVNNVHSHCEHYWKSPLLKYGTLTIKDKVFLGRSVCVTACQVIVIIIMYIYHALINALSAHMIHINLNMIFYTHGEHSPTKTIYIKYYNFFFFLSQYNHPSQGNSANYQRLLI